MHFLARSIETFPEKSCPQNRVRGYDPLPRSREHPRVEILGEFTHQLLDIHARVLGRQAVVEHAVLHRSERIGILNLISDVLNPARYVHAGVLRRAFRFD